jgi:hypothetical protein
MDTRIKEGKAMSEYCDTCDEHLDWLEGNLDNRNDCVRCQLKAAKRPLLDALEEICAEGRLGAGAHNKMSRTMHDIAERAVKFNVEEDRPPTATRLGFEVGRVYRMKGDDRCTYHIVCETHYTAVYRDGSHAPVTAEICNLGTMKDDYELDTPMRIVHYSKDRGVTTKCGEKGRYTETDEFNCPNCVRIRYQALNLEPESEG